MDVLIRADASLAMGQGHVMRCLTLAGTLREQGLMATFVCREHPGNLCDFIEAQGFPVKRLPMPGAALLPEAGTGYAAWLGGTWADDAAQTRAVIEQAGARPHWLVVDHYGLDARWENSLRASMGRIMVIDDLADRPHDADLLLDQNLYPDMEGRYAGLIKADCIQLLGPKHALLRREFMEAREHLRSRDGSIRRVLIFFGGSDATNETGKALDAMAMLNLPEVDFDIVVGAANPRRDQLAARCEAWPHVRFHCQISHMSELMSAADLSLGAGGSTTWERCATGLPSLVISVADNQVAIARGVDQAKAQRYLGADNEVSAHVLASAITALQDNPKVLQDMSTSALALVDARGADRVVAALKGVL
jgi:UDP-2,4-diacetamido-2,4,6-trideoxy-beta-L-altropyranose hydrolase